MSELVLPLSGDLDVATVAEWETNLKAAVSARLRDVTGIVLDLSRVTFMDSRGVELLVVVSNHCNDQGCGYALQAVSPTNRRLLQVSGLTDVFDIRDDG